MTLRQLLPMPMNEKRECNDHQIYSKMLRNILEYKTFHKILW